MKKLSFLARCVMALLVTMFAAMLYAPTASASTGPPVAHYADIGKTQSMNKTACLATPHITAAKRANLFRTRQIVALMRTAQAVGFITKRMDNGLTGYDVKDDPHIG
jgi:hypothetical protein